MDLSNTATLRAAIEREVDELSGASGGDVELPDKQIDELVDVLSQVPPDMREAKMRELVNDLVQRRLGDPRT